jgi:hypothetical protein
MLLLAALKIMGFFFPVIGSKPGTDNLEMRSSLAGLFFSFALIKKLKRFQSRRK